MNMARDLALALNASLVAPGLLAFVQRHHRTHQNKALTFVDRPWLKFLYEQPLEGKTVIRKPTQIGVTEWLLALIFYLCEQGHSGLYVMPTLEGMYTFVANRVNRIILHASHYASLVSSAAGANATILKHLGRGGIKFVGANAEAGFTEYPATFVIIDEFDFCNQDNVALAQERLKSTFMEEKALQFIVSTPTLPDWGIDREYKLSDQHEWTVPCPACGQEQTLDWFSHVVERAGGNYVLLGRDVARGEYTGHRHVLPVLRRAVGSRARDEQRALRATEPGSAGTRRSADTAHGPFHQDPVAVAGEREAQGVQRLDR